jgi:opacity protein-like surface antigen
MLGLVNAGSLGFAGDPLANGLSVKLGAEKGFQVHLITNFSSGENQVDSSQYVWSDTSYIRRKIYDTTFYRSYSDINLGLRAEYYFNLQSWFQPYVGLGVGFKKASRWSERFDQVDTSSTTTPELTTANYLGPIGAIGIDFYPIPFLSKLLKLDIPFEKAISFNIEICPFYLVTHDFKGSTGDNGYYESGPFTYMPEHTFSGIGAGAGIHFNWGRAKSE